MDLISTKLLDALSLIDLDHYTFLPIACIRLLHGVRQHNTVVNTLAVNSQYACCQALPSVMINSEIGKALPAITFMYTFNTKRIMEKQQIHQ